MKLLASTLLLSWLGVQSPAFGPIRLGPTGDRVTSDDLDQIRRLISSGNDSIWVVVGHKPGFVPSMAWSVSAYLEPDRASARIRRGRMFTMRAVLPSPNAYDQPKTWERASDAEYAQAPATGTDPNVVTGGRDLNRPFNLQGAFTDDSLRDIVDLIRRSPTAPAPSAPPGNPPAASVFSQVQGSWPISSMRVIGDTVEVALLYPGPLENSVQVVSLRKVGSSWHVERIKFVIAD
jgi:hypothetical protein